ncbi:MAG: class I tRNA ligase family protein, partial [Nanopusillaceae archaeon]
MDKRPNYKEIEFEIRDLWFNKRKDLFKFDLKKSDKIYIIDSPPPFTSGEAHMGHMLGFTWIDFIARYKRLEGYNVYFPLGFDCHGLP